MLNLREQLRCCFEGRVCLLGLGNADGADDGLGVRLAEALSKAEDSIPFAGRRHAVIVAGTAPERWVGRVADDGFEHIIFLDAVEFGGSPGAVVFLDAKQITARFPQISTHKLSLGLLAKRVEAEGRTKAWLLGVQPGSLRAGGGLTPKVEATVELLRQLLEDVSTEVLA
jgi:hydrogenase 3 maturation protease